MLPRQESRVARYCKFVSDRAGTILTAAFLLFGVATFLASRLDLKTDFAELLPSDDPGVIALEKTQKRMGDISLLLIGIHSPNRAANLRYAQRLTEELRRLPKSLVSLVTYDVRDVEAFFQEHKWLYASVHDLEALRDRLRNVIAEHENPLFVRLSDQSGGSLSALRERLLKQGNPVDQRFPGGVLGSEDGQYVWVAALSPAGLFTEHGGERLYAAAHRLIEEHPPHDFDPRMTAFVGGPLATAIASRLAVERDIVWVTVVCLVIVAFSIWFYFRRLRALPLVAASAVIGTVMAFAVAWLAFGYVNSSTAFLGTIILGNGINHAIILMSRYEERRAAGQTSSLAMEQAVAGVSRGTGVAAVCASAAYATLMVTRFRGFYQFGVMAAFGVLFCWLLTFTVLPALLFLMDRRGAGNDRAPTRAPLTLSFLGGWLSRHYGAVAAVSVGLTLFGAVGMLHFARAPFEYDFRKLNVNLESTERARAFNHDMERTFGRWPSPIFVLADSRAEVEDIRAAIWRQDRTEHVIGEVITINDVLPGTRAEQMRKIALLRDIRRLTHLSVIGLLGEKERKVIAQLDIPEHLHVLTPGELPPLARRPFTEVDGTIGRVVLVYPTRKHLSIWNGRDLLRIAKVLEYLHLPKEHKTIVTSGSAVVFAAMIRSILHDGPRATAASLFMVLAFSFLIMRPRAAALSAVATLIVGVVWMLGIAGALGVKITFINFIALPITFGIGAEYGLNLAQRYRSGGNMAQAISSTGAAVALCSWTTIVGYGSLLAASNRALQGFGMMAVLGEVCCLAAALLALPAAILYRQESRRRRRPP